jgi:hypothetical protein
VPFFSLFKAKERGKKTKKIYNKKSFPFKKDFMLSLASLFLIRKNKLLRREHTRFDFFQKYKA